MRILSVGFPLPGAAIDNYTFLSAPAFFDYDAIVVDPRTLSQLIDDVVGGTIVHTTYSGEAVVNGTSGPGVVSLAELLHNRADETARLLARGGLVVCLAIPNAAHEGVHGFASVDRYCWLPAPYGLTYDSPFMKRGPGRELAPTDVDHPFGAMLERVKARVAFQIYFEDDASSLGRCVVARSIGGVPVAVELPVGDGRIVLLPPPARALDSQGRYEMSEALQQAMHQSLRLRSGSNSPRWLSEYPPPGLSERLAERDEATRHLSEAQSALENCATDTDELRGHQRLLWEEGRIGLEKAARQALTLLGFRVWPDAIDAPSTIELGGPGPGRRAALLETEGSEEAVGLSPHYRLRRRIEESLAVGSLQRGVLLING